MLVQPTVLIVRTQSWLQVTRLIMRLAANGCQISILAAEESQLFQAPHPSQRFRFQLLQPLHSLRRALQMSKADYVLPTDDLSVFLLHELADQEPSLRPLIEASIGAREHYSILRSRFQLLSLADQLGIRVPKTELVTKEEDLRALCLAESPAFALKKDGTWGGEGVQIVYTPEEALTAFRKLNTAPGLPERTAQWLRKGDGTAFARLACLRHPEITAQEVIRGVPANSMYACHRGEILGEVQARVLASKGKTGASLVIQTMQDPRITEAGRLLAQKLELSGFFGLDFILKSETNEPVLIELNPRSTKLGHIAVAGGTDLAGHLCARWIPGFKAPLGAQSLGSSICFHPEGSEWADKVGILPEYRADNLPGEDELLALLKTSKPSRAERLRQHLWNSLSGLRNALREDVAPSPYHHLEPSRMELQVTGRSATAQRAS